MDQKKRGFIAAIVMANRETAPGSKIFQLDLRVDGRWNVRAGQFIRLEPLCETTPLPRPFSVCDIDSCKAGSMLQIIFKVVGKNTEFYSRLEARDKIGIDGPHGQPIMAILPKADNYILVAGGIGVAGLLLLARELRWEGTGVIVLIGTKSEDQLFGTEYFSSLGCEIASITGDEVGSYVTEFLAKALEQNSNDAPIVACGPRPMLKRVSEMCSKAGRRCYVLLEEIMGCGVGSCKSCAVFTTSGVRYVCQDGPGFDASEIDWNKFCPTVTKPQFSGKMSREPFRTILRSRDKKRVLEMEYPTMNAAGCLDVKAIENGQVDISKFGALITKSVTEVGRLGNSHSRICEVESGMLNSIGMENPGQEEFIQNVLPRWLKIGLPIIVNIAGGSIEEFRSLAARFSTIAIAALEVNVSCPNVQQHGIFFGTSPVMTRQVTRAVRRAAPNVYLIVKLTPAVSDIVAIARAVFDGGADAVTIANTMPGMKIDVRQGRPAIGNIYGGMSGQALRPINLRLVHLVRQAFPKVTIIGSGGIDNANSAAEYFMAGAHAVQVGTALFSMPDAITQIVDGLVPIIKHHGLRHISDMVGFANR